MSENPKMSAKTLQRMCPTCGTQFCVTRKRGRPPEYCSEECRPPRRRRTSKRTCQTCGQTFGGRPHLEQRYCSHRCAARARRVRETVICQVCSKSFEAKPSDHRKYCSAECAYEALRKDAQERKCEQCGRTFQTQGATRFCSDACRNRARRHPECHTHLTCDWCGKNFSRFRSTYRYNRTRFCSRKCFNNWQRAQYPEHKDKDGYPNTFNDAVKTAIRTRDGYRCVLCGRLARAVHHIDYAKYNQDEHNLVTLCAVCHGRLHSRSNARQKEQAYWKLSHLVESGQHLEESDGRP